MKLILHTYELQLKHPFTISRGTRTTIPSLVVELKEGTTSGFGEATANPYYQTRISDFITKLGAKKKVIEALNPLDPEDFWAQLFPHFNSDMFLLCALDEAYCDLFGKLNKLKLYDYWNLQPNPALQSNYTIGLGTVEEMILKMQEVAYPIYKIKLGTPDDLKIVRELRSHSKAVFRIDANCAWNAEETITNAFELKELGVEFIEQPLPADDWAGAKRVYKQSVLPVIADESCLVEDDVQSCVDHFHGINVKLMKCGGPTPAFRMLQYARVLGLKTMVGCMTESTVGISAIAHLTPLLDYVDMDGAALIVNDMATGVRLEQGNILFPDRNGTGVKLQIKNPVINF
jgi:L-alanine-DL-glutamate epimerase-like enolase superfamily enzyme